MFFLKLKLGTLNVAWRVEGNPLFHFHHLDWMHVLLQMNCLGQAVFFAGYFHAGNIKMSVFKTYALVATGLN